MNGKEMKKLREELQMTQTIFAEQIGIKKSYLSKLEHGKKRITCNLETRIREVFQFEGGTSPVEAKLDFLRVRFAINSPEKVVETVLKMDMSWFNHRDYGFYYYSEMYAFNNIFVYVNPTKPYLGVLVEMKGQGCRTYDEILEENGETWKDFLYRITRPNLFGENMRTEIKVKRLDLALDEFYSDTEENYNLKKLAEKIEKE